MRHRPALVLAALGLLASCGDIEPFDPPVAGEMNPRPGLFSGPDGAFVLQRREPATLPAEQPAERPPRELTDPPPP